MDLALVWWLYVWRISDVLMVKAHYHSIVLGMGINVLNILIGEDSAPPAVSCLCCIVVAVLETARGFVQGFSQPVQRQ